MTDEEIYSLWFSKTDDLRYLRPRRWKEIKEIIVKRKVKSVLEFGSGVSTLLFSNMGLKVLSLETKPRYMKFVKSMCSPKVALRVWNNKNANIKDHYDLSLVDGVLPRNDQLRLAVKHSNIIVVDDFNEYLITEVPSRCKRIDPKTTTLAIFEKVNG